MVDNANNTSVINVIKDFAEHILSVPFQKLIYVGTDMSPVDQPGVPVGGVETKNYDFIVSSAGIDLAGTQRINYRSVTIPENITVASPLVISNFITNITNTPGSTRLFVFGRDVRDGRVTYDVFVTYVGAVGATDLELIVFPALLPTTDTAGSTSTNIGILQKLQPRVTAGGIRRYDCMLLN